MSTFSEFVDKCGAWGLLPNNQKAKDLYGSMRVMGQLGPMAGFSRKLKKLCINIPDISGVDDLVGLKKQGASTRINVVVVCHEIFHYLHFLVDENTFLQRSAARIPAYDNEEELLTIAGDTGRIMLPGSIQEICQPKLFNENSLCKILNLTVRPDHHSKLADNTSGDSIDLSSLPKAQTTFADLW